MARYIDADKIDLTKYKIGRSLATDWIDIEDVKRAIALTPTADVVPKSEVDKTIAEWAWLHAGVLNKLDNAKAEAAREIFAEIEKTIRAALILVGFSYKHQTKEMECRKECYEDLLGYIAELKKKYTEVQT